MPPSHVVYYQEKEGHSPVVDWLKELRQTHVKAFIKCRAALDRLGQQGHELRRPEADYLCEGIHELRIRFGSVNYRLLYFFHAQTISVVAHGCTKEDVVPPVDIQRAIIRKIAFNTNPTSHTYKGDIDHA